MKIYQREFSVNGVCYTIRPAINKDAKDLSEIRLQVDGETEYLDREEGEAYINHQDILVTSGTQQGSDLVARTFIGSGDVVVVESATYPAAIKAKLFLFVTLTTIVFAKANDYN